MFGGIGYSGHIDDKLKQIIGELNNFSYRPAFTTGRGAILSDLDSPRIEHIYVGIKKKFGKKAASAYIQMVVDLKDASASQFLINLYDLCNNGWNNLSSQSPAIQVDKDDDGNITEDGINTAMFGVMETMMRSGVVGDTMRIKMPFLQKYASKEQLKTIQDENPVRTYYY